MPAIDHAVYECAQRTTVIATITADIEFESETALTEWLLLAETRLLRQAASVRDVIAQAEADIVVAATSTGKTTVSKILGYSFSRTQSWSNMPPGHLIPFAVPAPSAISPLRSTT